MNKNVITSYVQEPNILQPLVVDELDWIQSGLSGMTQGIVQGLVGNSAFSGSPCIISGLRVSDMKQYVGGGGGVDYYYQPCWIWEPNTAELYYFVGNTINYTLGEYFYIQTTFPDPADPVEFSDGNSYYVMEYKTLNINNTASGASFTYSALTSLTAEDWVTVGASGAPSFQNSWQTRSPAVQFKFNPISQRVYIQGSALNSSTAGSGQVVFTLPIGYRPSQPKEFACFGEDNTTNPSIIQVQINTSGEVVAVWLNSPSTNLIGWFDNISFSIND
jgi:hypothetical protein